MIILCNRTKSYLVFYDLQQEGLTFRKSEMVACSVLQFQPPYLHCSAVIICACVCVCLFAQGERGPKGPVEEVCGGGTDAEERGEPGQ